MKTELLILLIDLSIALMILASKYFTKIMATNTHEMKKCGTEENKKGV